MNKLLALLALAFAFLLSLAFVSAQWAIGQSLAGTPAIYNLTHWVGIGIIPNATLDVVNWSRMQGLRVHSLIVDGSIGIGTIEPLSKLSVGGSGDANAAIYGNGTSIGIFGNSDYGIGVLGKGDHGVKGEGNVYGVSGSGGLAGGYFTNGIVLSLPTTCMNPCNPDGKLIACDIPYNTSCKGLNICWSSKWICVKSIT